MTPTPCLLTNKESVFCLIVFQQVIVAVVFFGLVVYVQELSMTLSVFPN
jgi:hypothetical protein